MHNITNYSDYSKCVNHKLSSILENFVKVKKFSKVEICNLVDGFTAPSMSKFLANNDFGAVETKHNVYNQLAQILDEEEFKPMPLNPLILDRPVLNQKLRDDLQSFLDGEKKQGIILTHAYVFDAIDFIYINTLFRFKRGEFNLKAEKILMFYDFLKIISDNKIYYDYEKGEFINDYI